jgi:hypothetical protein
MEARVPMHQHLLEVLEGGPIGAEECRLEVAALLEARTHAAGIGWRLGTAGRAGPVRTETRRRGGTLISSELAAVRRGLNDAARRGCRALLVCVPDPRAVALMRGEHLPRFRRAEAAAARLKPILARFRAIRFQSDFVPDAELEHGVGEALDAGLHAAAEREEHRIFVMEHIVERAKGVTLERGSTGWVANGRYRVQLDPMRCECPAWTARWAGAPIGARRAQRLPCKHLVALALHEGITVPADLAEMARRAP